MKIKPPHMFVAVEMKVYPTNEPDRAQAVEVPEQTAKMDAIRRGMDQREIERLKRR